MKIYNLYKLQERMCYDSYWRVETDEGTIDLHLYDGMSKDTILEQLKGIKTLEGMKAIEPKHFYFD